MNSVPTINNEVFIAPTPQEKKELRSLTSQYVQLKFKEMELLREVQKFRNLISKDHGK